MEIALVCNGAKDAISLAITKLNIDMHHVLTVFYFQAFELRDNGRSNGSKPRQAARKCHLKVQKPGSKSKIKISMWRPVVLIQSRFDTSRFDTSRFDTSRFDASINSIRYKLKVSSIHIVSIQHSDG